MIDKIIINPKGTKTKALQTFAAFLTPNIKGKELASPFTSLKSFINTSEKIRRKMYVATISVSFVMEEKMLGTYCLERKAKGDGGDGNYRLVFKSKLWVRVQKVTAENSCNIAKK